MLTLFRPWRNGNDLKLQGKLWNEAFEKYAFTPRQHQIMDNFNIRYECNDARDDFSSQMKQNMINLSTYIQNLTINEMGDPDYGDGDDFENEEGEYNTNYEANYYTILGPRGKAILAQMSATEICVRNAGWLEESPDGLNVISTIPRGFWK